MYGQYDSSDGSMDAMGLNVDKKMYKKSGIEFHEEIGRASCRERV